MEIKCINSIYTDRNDVSSCFISVKRNINPIQIFLNIKKMIYICIQKEIPIYNDRCEASRCISRIYDK